MFPRSALNLGEALANRDSATFTFGRSCPWTSDLESTWKNT